MRARVAPTPPSPPPAAGWPKRRPSLAGRTLREEDRLSARLATLHEDVADAPLLPLVIKDLRTSASAPGSPSASGGRNAAAAAAAAADAGGGWSGEKAAPAAMESYAGRLAGLPRQPPRVALHRRWRRLLPTPPPPASAAAAAAAAAAFLPPLAEGEPGAEALVRRSLITSGSNGASATSSWSVASLAESQSSSRKKIVLGKEPDQLAFWEVTHKKKNENFVNEDAENSLNRTRRKFVELSQNFVSDKSKLIDEAFLNTMGSAYNGRVKGLGLRPTLRTYPHYCSPF
uniref:Uncharacterized protein n=1 Tax=Ananas comosus var. bracteatus TaxID=296719 RepID=A0A6V7P4Z1_ANACO|nr:unnamed protein product [Ananas comosus var. bracteatus]